MLFACDKKKALALAVRTAVFCAALFAATSCAEDLFCDFRVENSFIADGKVTAVFSAELDPASAKKNFSFAQDETQMDGQLFFAENILTFVPLEKICENHCYKIQVFSGAMDTRGNRLVRDYCNTVWTKSDLTRPEIAAVRQLGQGLEISFTKEVDRRSFMDAFSVEPQKEFFARWEDGGKKVFVDFKNGLEEKTLHSIKIKADLKDTKNNFMANDYYWSWTTDGSAEIPTLDFYAYSVAEEIIKKAEGEFNGADFAKEIEIRFSKEINSESLAAAIQVEPPLPYELIPHLKENTLYCSSAKIKFSEAPKWEQKILVIAKAKIEDRDGRTTKEKRLAIINNAEERRPPKLEFAAMKILDAFATADKKNNFACATFPISDYPEGVEKELAIFFVYSISQKSREIDRLSAMEATSVQSNSCASVSLLAMESKSQEKFFECADFYGDAEIQKRIQGLSAQGKRLALVKCGATFKNRLQDGKPASGTIEFKASQKLRDDKKNFMEEKVLLTFNKN